MENLTGAEKIKATISKLLNLAKGSTFDGEIENAMRHARKMMMENNISENDLHLDESPKQMAEREEYGKQKVNTNATSAVPWERILVRAICLLIGTVKNYRDENKVELRNAIGILIFNANEEIQYRQQLVFYGPIDDAIEATAMFREWSEIIISMARLKYGGCFRGQGRDYADGFAQSLLDGVQKAIAGETKQIEMEKGSGKELVIVRANEIILAKKQKAIEWLASTGVRLHNHSGAGVRSSSDAYSHGRSDGGKTSMGRNQKLIRIGR